MGTLFYNRREICSTSIAANVELHALDNIKKLQYNNNSKVNKEVQNNNDKNNSL